MWDATDAILRLAKIFGLYEQVQGAYTAYMDAKHKADAMTTAMEQDVIVVGQVLWSGVIVLCPSGWVMR